MSEDLGKAGHGAALQRHPAREFFRDLARARQLKRRMLAELGPGSPWLDVLHGREPWGDRATSRIVPPAQEAGPEGVEHAGRLPGGDLDGATATAPAIVALVPKKFGVNMVREYERYVEPSTRTVASATRYGAGGQPLADLGRLGASLAWQVGDRDLRWAFILRQPDARIQNPADLLLGWPVPSFASLSGATAFAMATADRACRVAEHAELLVGARDAGVKLVLTFLTLGGNVAGTITPVPSWMPRDCNYDNKDFQRTWVDEGLVLRQFSDVLPLAWDEESHAGQQDRQSPPNHFPVRSSAGGACMWHLASLDPTAGYKRSGLRLLAAYAAGLTHEALVAAGIGSVSEVVDAINLFNEVEKSSQFQSDGVHRPAAGGEWWGRACAWAAAGIRAVFPGASPKIGQPGMLTYAPDGAVVGGLDRSWDASKAHLQGLVKGYVAELLGPGLAARPEDLKNYLQCLDVHWYHSDHGDAWHAGFMVLDLAELPGVVETGVREGFEDAGLQDAESFVVEVMRTFTLRVSETGCSATVQTRDLPKGFTDPAAFQAFEVFRRLAAALASVARAGSWHSWLAGNGAYDGYGLREDGQAESDPPSCAVPRPSWYAYRRLAELLAHVGQGRMLLPDVAVRDDLIARLADPRLRSLAAAVVFEYELAPLQAGAVGFRYAYLAFLDPTVELSSVPVLATRWRASRAGSAWRHALEPSRTWLTPSGSGGPPEGHALYPPRQPFAVGGLVPLARGDMPLFVTANARIDWSVTLGGLGVPAPGTPSSVRAARIDDLLERPAWLDDPGAPLPGRRA